MWTTYLALFLKSDILFWINVIPSFNTSCRISLHLSVLGVISAISINPLDVMFPQNPIEIFSLYFDGRTYFELKHSPWDCQTRYRPFSANEKTFSSIQTMLFHSLLRVSPNIYSLANCNF